jgi:carbamoyltransferase
MKILGINHDMFITSAALINDGKIISAIPEERISREKLSRKFPEKAINQILKENNLDINNIDIFSNSYNPANLMTKFNPIFSTSRRFRSDYLYSVPDNLFKINENINPINSEYLMQEIKIKNKTKKIYFVNHHLAHAANAFFISPFKKSAILTADGRGEIDSCSFSLGVDNKINLIKKISFPHSVGSFYSTFTEFLGYKANSDEWKVMALSSYCKNKKNKFYKLIKKLVKINKSDGTFILNTNYFKETVHEYGKMYSDEFVKLFGPPRKKDEKITSRHNEIAGAMQVVSEEIVLNMLNWLQKKTKSENLSVSGGFFMNSVFNGKITKLTKFKNIFISSCPDDSGLSIGAALYVYNHILNRKKRYIQKHNYYGPSFSNDEIKKTLDNYKINYSFNKKNLSKIVAKKISEGKIIGWFQGKMEFGQRALGNRSILGDPRILKNRDKINQIIKFRESFRPFAPAILNEKKEDFFLIRKNETANFMEKVFLIKNKMHNKIPAVTHIDGSGRLQTVEKTTNPKFYDLIKEFFNITSIPILINTSFNLNGEPIVCTPQDAIRTFNTSGLDMLVIGDFIISKQNEKV